MILKWKFKEELYGDDVCLTDSEWEATVDPEHGDEQSDSIKARPLWAILTPTVRLIQPRPLTQRGRKPAFRCLNTVIVQLLYTEVLWWNELPSKNSYQKSKNKDQMPKKWDAAGRNGLWRNRDSYTSNEIGGMMRGGKPYKFLPCAPKIPRGTVWDRTPSSTVRSRWLTARDITRPLLLLNSSISDHYTGFW